MAFFIFLLVHHLDHQNYDSILVLYNNHMDPAGEMPLVRIQGGGYIYIFPKHHSPHPDIQGSVFHYNF